ncbi:ROK family transcriptional regulator [Pseudoduganella chitinolytica]|uniref:ROK family transcriptional regulator n=1 Tax=Pseudoduganella chitinolytica TaxID=34070 RepID=A0ABY8BF23_9BURK|nr:ROK family transcriptional regulator [Pseudoduganella chitinolytica]WEF33576.1 ROK family transcriptional regulator [Pseudoduganella chitinolytica]
MTPCGAVPAADSDWLRPRGSSQSGMSHFNERVLLQAIRLNGALPQAELARLTRLSTQAVALIVRRLIAQGLVAKGAPRRGKVGQPSVPIRLDPDGAYFIGVKIGRRGIDLLLVDFAGQVRARSAVAYRYPDPDLLFGQIDAGLQALRGPLGLRQARLRGIGVAAPLGLGGWQTLLGGDAEHAGRWERIDLRARVQALSNVPVVFAKDTIAACVAELVAGHGRSLRSFVYVFVGTFIGGALVLDSSVHAGLTGNAGAFGSLPTACGDRTTPSQLLGTASLFGLEQRFARAGLDDSAAHDARALQPPWLAHTEDWLDGAARAIALAVCNATCLVDVGHVVLDSSGDPALLARLLERSTDALSHYRWEGVRRPVLLGGVSGADARAVGAALLPLHADFAPDRDLFLKILNAAA